MEPVRNNHAAGAMPAAHAALWERIRTHPFECAGDGVDFLSKLAREQGWTRDFARAAIDEYRRYCFLAVTADRDRVPSDAVDQVWHLHLTYTRDYWTVFCPTVLGCDLHHEPSRARKGDVQRFADSYAETLAAYADAFGPPPEPFWPGTRERFRHPARFRRIDIERHFVIARPQLPSLRTIGMMLAALVLAFAARSVFATAFNPLDWNGGQFLILYIVLAIACLIATIVWRRHLRDNGATGNEMALDTWDIAYLAGGSERVMDSAVARLMRDNIVVWDAAAKRLKTAQKTSTDDPLLDRIARHLAIESNPRRLARRLDPELTRIRDKLAARGLLLDADATSRAAWLPMALPAALLAFGIAKVMIGLSRDKPVSILVVIMIVVAIASIVAAFATPARALAGDRALAALKARHAHTARAPRPDDLPLAVALAGTAVLATTPYGAYHQFRQPSSGGNGDSSSSSSCSGGGGGCGGCGGGGD
jgi:uncharacterized protein (TIGR04222 family)